MSLFHSISVTKGEDEALFTKVQNFPNEQGVKIKESDVAIQTKADAIKDVATNPPALAEDAINFSLTNSASFSFEAHEIITNAVRVYITNRTSVAASTVVTMSLMKLF